MFFSEHKLYTTEFALEGLEELKAQLNAAGKDAIQKEAQKSHCMCTLI